MIHANVNEWRATCALKVPEGLALLRARKFHRSQDKTDTLKVPEGLALLRARKFHRSQDNTLKGMGTREGECDTALEDCPPLEDQY
jgi:hypothetical protein